MEKSVFTADYELLRKMLREARKGKGVTQVELAERLNETQSFVSKCERGERRLDLVQLNVFCRALRIPLLEFVQEFVRRCSKKPAQSSAPSRVPSTRATRE